MEFRFTPIRLGILAALIIAFYFFGGFSGPELLAENEAVSGKSMRAWVYCVLMFLGGAVCVTIIDHYIGNFPPSSLRPLYIILGVILMMASCLWLHSLFHAWEIQLNR